MSKQIRHEAATIFYADNEVQISACLNLAEFISLPRVLEEKKYSFKYMVDFTFIVQVRPKEDEQDCSCEDDVPDLEVTARFDGQVLDSEVNFTQRFGLCKGS